MNIDVKNAFNTIEWGEIRRAVEQKKIPEYLRRIIGKLFEQ